MSCINNKCYLPQPARAWSRVQNSCSLTTNIDNNGIVKVPLTGEIVTAYVLAQKMAMLNKGNILQYKANSSNLTKAQRYSKIAKGQWTNRNTTWATQSTRGYTNPNTNSLKRSGNVVNIAINPITRIIIGPTLDPVTCIRPIIPDNFVLQSNEVDVMDPIARTIIGPMSDPATYLQPIIPDNFVLQSNGVDVMNPNTNTNSLNRFGNVINIALGLIPGTIIGPMSDPATYFQPIIPDNSVLPSNGGGGSDVMDPNIPPPVDPSPSSYVFPDIIPDTPVEPIVIQDEGILICSVQENVCTGVIKHSISQKLCNPTTDSDVPGQIQDLCWNDGTPTWYPRQRYIMTNSDNKWPVNAKLSSSIKPYAPYIISATANVNVVTLKWSQNEDCVYVSRFDIFQDGVLIKSVDGTIFTTDVIVPNCNYYQYFIVGGTTGNVVSDPSNLVGINIAYIEQPTNLSYTTTASGTITLTWNPPCFPPAMYGIYNNSGLIDYTTNVYYSISGLTNCSTYTYLVSSLDASSSNETAITVTVIWPDPPTNLLSSVTGSGQILLSWSSPITSCDTTNSYNIYNITSGTYIGNTTNLYYTINSLTNCSTYDFYVSTVGQSGNESSPNPTTSIQVLWPDPPTNLSYLVTGSGQITLSWLAPITYCDHTISYNIYNNSVFIGNTTNLNFIISGLENCSTYTYSVSTVGLSGHESTLNQITNVTLLWPNPPTNLSYLVTGSGQITLSWLAPTSYCVNITSYNIYENTVLVYTVSAPYLTKTIIGLDVCTSYSYYITAIANSNESYSSNTVNVDPLLWPGVPTTPTIAVTSATSITSASVTLQWYAPTTNICTQVTYNLYYNNVLVASNVSELFYIFTNIAFYNSNVYGVQSSAIITGITQTSDISNTTFTAIPFNVTGNPTIQPNILSKNIVQYTDITPGTNSINFWVQPTHFNYVVVGGGGAGGAGQGTGQYSFSYDVYAGGGGGGGGGEVTSGVFSPTINTSYDIVVGAGGSGTYLYQNGTPEIYAGGQSNYGNGSISSFNSITANGGYSGQGEYYYDGTSNQSRTTAPLGGNSGGTSGVGGAGCSSYVTTGPLDASAGANGTEITIYDTVYTFGGGGGGGSTYNINPAVTGGSGGGGSGGCGGDSPTPVIPPNPGRSNTGGGGGGGGCFGSTFGTNYYSTFGTAATRQGGSGTVVLSFDYN